MANGRFLHVLFQLATTGPFATKYDYATSTDVIRRSKAESAALNRALAETVVVVPVIDAPWKSVLVPSCRQIKHFAETTLVAVVLNWGLLPSLPSVALRLMFASPTPFVLSLNAPIIVLKEKCAAKVT
jgi:hypothetical protein